MRRWRLTEGIPSPLQTPMSEKASRARASRTLYIRALEPYRG